MTSRIWSLMFASLALIGGCGTPSVHPLASEETNTTDPALVGAWAQAGKGESVYTVARQGDHYRLTVEDRDAKPPEKWEFQVRLVQLGQLRFVDIQAPEADRKSLDEKWSSLVIPTHLFGRYAIEGDTLRFWILSQEWLTRSLAQGKVKLAHTRIDHGWILITASTAELQDFVKEHALDPDAFDLTELKRVQP